MIPELDVASIENRGERLFYEAAAKLPREYTVIYNYKYKQYQHEELVREIDFIVIHPSHGFVVVEVKQGEAAYHAGRWHEFKLGGYLPLFKDPVEQARTGMFHVLHHFKHQNQQREYPLRSKYVVCFPESTRIGGKAPADLLEESIWLEGHLQHLETSITNLLPTQEHPGMKGIQQKLVKALTPSLHITVKLPDRIQTFHQKANHILSVEQERIIEETNDNPRMLFLGAAGTGKTYVAIEKARRMSRLGKRVLLTCYNKHLVQLLKEQTDEPAITVQNFHDLIESILQDNGRWVQPDPNHLDEYYNNDLPMQGYMYYNEASDSEKYDVILVDEGQDFREDWLICLESMLRPDGEFHLFADPNQNIFNIDQDWKRLKKFTPSTIRLTQNFRNTEEINNWTVPFMDDKPVKSRLWGGYPVATQAWSEPAEQKRLIEKEIGRLISQEIAPSRITILSPYKRDNSCLQGVERLRDWPLVDFNSGEPGIQFATIRSFKGLESDILLLIDIKPGSKACTPADIYVGASRARYLLHVFHHKDWEVPE